MNWPWQKPKVIPSLACVARVGTSGIAYEHHDLSLIQTAPQPTNLTPPAGDGVYTKDHSPPIGSFKWNKNNITYCLVMPDQNNKLIDIPNDHDLTVSVNTAFTKAELFTNIKCTKISDWTKADVSIKLDKSDPMFTPPAGLKVSNIMAYCHFPGTTPAGVFTCAINPSILYSEDGKFNFSYNINETILHEAAGHGLGCVHTTNPKDIMYPFYHNDHIPTAMDTYQWQFMYGPRNPPVNPIEIQNFFVNH